MELKKVQSAKRGEVDETEKYLTLIDGSKIECLNSEDRYKFLGVPENKEHDIVNIVSSIKKVIKQRARVI